MTNPLEDQLNLGRRLVELNVSTLQRLGELSQSGMQKYVQTMQDYGSKVAEVKDIAGLLELQREYGEALWNAMQESMRSQGEIVQGSFEEAGKLVQSAFSQDKNDAA